MSEKRLWGRIRKQLRFPAWRLECTTPKGIPDVMIATENQGVVLVEIKQWLSGKKRHPLSVEQLNILKQSGGYVLIETSNGTYTMPGIMDLSPLLESNLKYVEKVGDLVENINWNIQEQWVPVYKWEDSHVISSYGRIRRVNGKCLKTGLNPRGYPIIKLSDKGKRKTVTLHGAVTKSFFGPLPTGKQTRHLNNDKTNSFLYNLAYGTQSENEADKKLHGTNVYGEKDGASILTDKLVMEARERYAGGETQASIGEDIGVDSTTISLAVLGKTWKHLPLFGETKNGCY